MPLQIEVYLEPETINAITLAVCLSQLTARAQAKDIPDGVYFENDILIVEKKDGIVTTSGKPMREVLIYGGF